MPNRWNDAARTRRSQIESGLDLTFNEVFKPFFVDRIVALSPTYLLEIGAGTGHLSKELSKLNISITAIEPSTGMYDVAKDVLAGSVVELINCTSNELGQVRLYDVIISHLVAHSVEDLKLFFESISRQLGEDGVFLFSIPHPCFYNEYKGFFGDEYRYMTTASKEISLTITKDSENKMVGVPYHHRPLSSYINILFETGLGIQKFDEIYPEAEIQEKYGVMWDTPRYCVFTCKNL